METVKALDGAQLEHALSFMCAALEVLDRLGPLDAAATLSLAIEQAGGSAPPLDASGEI